MAGRRDDLILGEQYVDSESALVFYRPVKGELERPGLRGRRPAWMPGGRHIAFVRGGECVVFDLISRSERRLFSVTPNEIYSINLSRPEKIYFTQTIHRSTLWLGNFAKVMLACLSH